MKVELFPYFLEYLDQSKNIQIRNEVSCQNFWDKVWWFLSLRVFGLFSSSLLLFPQRFGRYILQPSSGVCWIREPTRNFELVLYWIHGGHLFWFRKPKPCTSVKLLRRQSSRGCRFNPNCRRVTIQKYLTLVPGYV